MRTAEEALVDQLLNVALGTLASIGLFHGREDPADFLPRVDAERIAPHHDLHLQLDLALVIGIPVRRDYAFLLFYLDRPFARKAAGFPILLQAELRGAEDAGCRRRKVAQKGFSGFLPCVRSASRPLSRLTRTFLEFARAQLGPRAAGEGDDPRRPVRGTRVG